MSSNELIRYGIKWNGPENPITTEMTDGYWTPFHISNDVINKLKIDIAYEKKESAKQVAIAWFCALLWSIATAFIMFSCI